MVRDTSIAAYHAIKERGLLSERRFQVYEIFVEANPRPLTGSQVSRLWHDRYQGSDTSEVVRSRITELAERGLLEEDGTVFDDRTEMMVIAWRVVDRLPAEVERRESKAQKVKRLETEVERLRRLVDDLSRKLEDEAERRGKMEQGSLFR